MPHRPVVEIRRREIADPAHAHGSWDPVPERTESEYTETAERQRACSGTARDSKTGNGLVKKRKRHSLSLDLRTASLWKEKRCGGSWATQGPR